MSKRVLGAILAGGQASRFGSDKAQALLDGRPLIDHVRDALAAQTHLVVICGRSGNDAIADRPSANLGPLGGLNAALHHGAAQGFDHMLTAGCDTPVLPPDLLAQLSKGALPAIVDAMPIIGLWPTALAARLDAYLAEDNNRSVRAFGTIVGARFVTLDRDIANINHPADLAQLQRSEG